ncbi:protein NBR1 homolog isoform X1 [Prunus yedoensis var. nudiflora]|uniref:Protein NBR1 homolog isoform X1 n=1 Tax=Prunus yedoensis var. nudiflora TaxID=2094558 RepID=A0A314Y8U3_PRUYE|nr:protein NBR1 homolog isoform X1 [Prunus yedoensis var. nudiflora]
MASTMVIKVKYGDTLRRFNALVNENDQLDLDMAGLRAKIFSLFNFHPDADIAMTYIDEDGDTVTLVDDDDLRDAMRQQLKFLRIDVHMNNGKAGKSYAKSSGSSTPLRSPKGTSPILNFKTGAAEVLKSLPEPLREFVSKLHLELASKAESSSPVLADLVDHFSNMGISYLIPDSQVPVGGDSATQSGFSKIPMAPSAAANLNDAKDDGKSGPILKSAFEESSSKKGQAMGAVNVTMDVGLSVPPCHATVDLNSLPTDFNPSGPAPVNCPPVGSSLHTSDERKETKEFNSPFYLPQKNFEKSLGCGASTSSAIPQSVINDMSSNHFNECPFTGTAIANPSATPVACRRIPFKRNHSEAMGGMFHTGVRCDGCGCHPIIGPRFKSVVKEDYDLCRICYSSMGNASDYIRIDHPVSYRHPRPFKGMYEQPPWVGPPILPKILRGCSMKSGRPKLDSRFVLDVNVMDGTLIAPSTPFTKIWRMRNTGGLIWSQGTQLMWIGGDRFSKSDSVEIEIPSHGVSADYELDVAVDFTAPESPGRYISYWRMASPSGQKFGQRVWVLIQVEASLKDSFFGSFQGLNLNLPPEICGSKEPEKIDVNLKPAAGNDFIEPSGSSSVKEPVKLMPHEQPENDQELHFPINDNLLVGHRGSATTEPQNSSTVSYPTVDIFESAPPSPKSAPVVNAPTSSKETSSNNGVEDTLLKELEEMGFKQVNLNKEILRRNEYNLEQSVDDLCDVADWDPILEELQEMGFCDAEMNKKLLVKNNGSIKRVVMDLINGEKL